VRKAADLEKQACTICLSVARRVTLRARDEFEGKAVESLKNETLRYLLFRMALAARRGLFQ
jgi:6-phosphogluconate dehydrogenase (decarboxylating)